MDEHIDDDCEEPQSVSQTGQNVSQSQKVVAVEVPTKAYSELTKGAEGAESEADVVDEYDVDFEEPSQKVVVAAVAEEGEEGEGDIYELDDDLQLGGESGKPQGGASTKASAASVASVKAGTAASSSKTSASAKASASEASAKGAGATSSKNPTVKAKSGKFPQHSAEAHARIVEGNLLRSWQGSLAGGSSKTSAKSSRSVTSSKNKEYYKSLAEKEAEVGVGAEVEEILCTSSASSKTTDLASALTQNYVHSPTKEEEIAEEMG
ncbi:hypothetical protein B484DRAFT_151422 [Ochromonadaceae sp. CCMP2298]|nr:hypothetical protein B484DRAFT_151422 [Ochromonadaceae sp. CCMP2298]